MVSYIFGGNTGETPESVKRKREVAMALLGAQSAPKNLGEGLSALGDGIVANVMNRRANDGEKAGRESAEKAFGGLDFGSLFGGAPAYPSSVAAGGSPTAPAATGVPSGANADSIKQGLVARGMPEHVADGFLMNFQDESGLNPGINEKNPTVAGSRGGFGLYQLTGPRRRAYEEFAAGRKVDPSDTDAQLDFLMTELQGPEANAAKSIFASKDSGSAAAAIARDFLRPAKEHLDSRVAKYTSGNAQQGAQVASLDPSVGMEQAFAPQQFTPEQFKNGMTIGDESQFSPEELQRIAARRGQAPESVPYSGPGARIGVQDFRAGQSGSPPNNYPEAGKVAPVDWTDQPQLSAAAGMQFANGQVPQGQQSPDNKAAVRDALLRKNDMILGGSLAPQGQQPSQVANNSGQYFPPTPSGDPTSGQNSNPRSAMVQQLMQAAQNPWMNENQQRMVSALLQNQMQQSDPRYQMGLEKDRLELDAMRNPKTKYDFVTGRDGSIFRTDNSGNMSQVYGGKRDTYRTMTADEKKQAGLPVEGAYQIGGDNKISQIGGGGTTVNIDQKSEGAFDKKLAENQATMFDNMLTEGQNAKSDLAVIGELGQALQGQGGILTGMSGRLARYGIGGENVSDLQAADALINKLIPTQRQAGSGSMSDRDVEMFRASLPSLWNTPEGNQKILGVMTGLAQYKDQQGAIAARVMNNEITRQQAVQELRALPNPLAGFGKDGKKGGNSALPQQGTVEDGYRFKGGNPSDPSSWEKVQ